MDLTTILNFDILNDLSNYVHSDSSFFDKQDIFESAEFPKIEGLKILAISASYTHTLVLAGDNQVYVAGSNECGELYLPGDIYETGFTKLDQDIFDLGDKIDFVSAGLGFSFLANHDGRGHLFVTGRNESGQLGLGFRESVEEMEDRLDNGTLFMDFDLGKIIDPSDEMIKIEAGRIFSLLLTKNGNLYVVGDNEYGQLGSGDVLGKHAFTRVNLDLIDGDKAIDISVGEYFSLLLTENGNLYATGDNEYGQLGIIGLESNYTDKFTLVNSIVIPDGDKIVAISAGSEHSIISTKNGLIYVTGSNEYGQLGLGPSIEYDNINVQRTKGILPIYKRVDLPDRVIKISAGSHHSVILTRFGRVYVAGYNQFSQLGITDEAELDKDIDVFTRVNLEKIITNDRVIDVIAAGNQTFLITRKNKIYAVGNNAYGQLGFVTEDYENLGIYKSSKGQESRITMRDVKRQKTFIEVFP